MSKRLIALLAAVLALGVIAGCGGSDSSDSSASDTTSSASESGDGSDGGPALSKAEFVKQGNEVCTQGKEDAEGELADFLADIEGGEPSEEDQERLVTEILAPSFEGISSGLAELTPPAGEEDALAELVAALEEATANIVDDPVAALEDDDPFADANEKAKALGLEVCAEN